MLRCMSCISDSGALEDVLIKLHLVHAYWNAMAQATSSHPQYEAAIPMHKAKWLVLRGVNPIVLGRYKRVERTDGTSRSPQDPQSQPYETFMQVHDLVRGRPLLQIPHPF